MIHSLFLICFLVSFIQKSALSVGQIKLNRTEQKLKSRDCQKNNIAVPVV